jgi:hypothetical protein
LPLIAGLPPLFQILVQGYAVTADNVETFLEQIYRQLMDFECCNAVSFSDMKDHEADSVSAFLAHRQ